VLGYGSAADPTAGLIGVIDSARKAQARVAVVFIGYVCGTDKDAEPRRECDAESTGVCRVVERGSGHVVRSHRFRPEGDPQMKSLFQQDLKVANVGLQGFADNIAAAGGQVTHLSWAPPAGADAARGWQLACLVGDARIAEANRIAYDRYLAAQPRLADLVLAKDAIAGLAKGERRILHSGPPIAWADMCGPQQGAITGALLYEGWAGSLEAAGKLAASGGVALEPCHEHGAVGPMAGIISPSMPVWVVENADRGNRAYCNLNEGLGKVLRFGANSPDVIERLRWLGAEFFTTMQVAVRGLADASLKPLMAQALHMGDELHNRNAAASGLLFKRFALALLASARQRSHSARARLRCRQRPFLPQYLDGRLQVDVGRRARCSRQQHGHGHGAQRRQLRHPPERHRQSLVPGACESGGRTLLPRLHGQGCRS
jgi:hypothetical protein